MVDLDKLNEAVIQTKVHTTAPLHLMLNSFYCTVKFTVISTDFEDLVKIKVAVPISDDNFPLEILDKTNGKVEPKKIGEDFIIY